MAKKAKECYITIDEQIESIESKIGVLQQHLRELKTAMKTSSYNNERCHDEAMADKAAFEAIQELCLDGLLEIEPKGEA